MIVLDNVKDFIVSKESYYTNAYTQIHMIWSFPWYGYLTTQCRECKTNSLQLYQFLQIIKSIIFYNCKITIQLYDEFYQKNYHIKSKSFPIQTIYINLIQYILFLAVINIRQNGNKVNTIKKRSF